MITLKYFASLRDIAEKEEDSLDIENNSFMDIFFPICIVCICVSIMQKRNVIKIMNA